MKGAYRLLSLIAAFRAAGGGPGPLGRFFVRRSAHGWLARILRSIGL